MKFTECRRVGFDTETSGVDPTTDRIVTAAIVAHGGGLPDAVFTWLINPGVPIPEDAAALHGITTEKAQAEGQDPKIALDEIAWKLAIAAGHGMPIVAYNLSFDWSILHHELARHSLPSVMDRLDGAVPVALVDPHVIDRQVDKYRPGSRKLQSVCEHYDVKLTDWHTAEADALAALLLADALWGRHQQLDLLDPHVLYLRQQRWRADWAAGFQAWLRDPHQAGDRHDPNAVVDGSWPLIPTPTTP